LVNRFTRQQNYTPDNFKIYCIFGHSKKENENNNMSAQFVRTSAKISVKQYLDRYKMPH
jgi:hypothetical protein